MEAEANFVPRGEKGVFTSLPRLTFRPVRFSVIGFEVFTVVRSALIAMESAKSGAQDFMFSLLLRRMDEKRLSSSQIPVWFALERSQSSNFIVINYMIRLATSTFRTLHNLFYCDR
jgi:hypothetical protein